jgi:hypothetical protein
MGKKRDGSIERYTDLYAHFENLPDEYRVIKQKLDIIAVYWIGPSGEPLEETVLHPVIHARLCVHYFHGIEVLRPDLTIPGKTIDELVKRLNVPRSLFKNAP